MKKSQQVTITIIVLVILLSIYLLTKSPPTTDQDIIKCIGENSVLYVQLGCHYCAIQEDVFGENLQYITLVDCFYEREKCGEIPVTSFPTWVIDREKYEGVQSINKLQELTGC